MSAEDELRELVSLEQQQVVPLAAGSYLEVWHEQQWQPGRTVLAIVVAGRDDFVWAITNRGDWAQLSGTTRVAHPQAPDNQAGTPSGNGRPRVHPAHE